MKEQPRFMNKYPTLEYRLEYEERLRRNFSKQHDSAGSNVKNFSELSKEGIADVLRHGEVEADERALFVFFKNAEEWLLVTSERVVWRIESCIESLKLSEIRSISSGSRQQRLLAKQTKDRTERAAARALYDRINIVAHSGNFYEVQVEAGSGCLALSEVLWMLYSDERMRKKWAQDPEAYHAHRFSSSNRASLVASQKCGCFYCLAIYSPEEIQEWIDEDSFGVRQTAMCARCGIDSVIADASGSPMTDEFLRRMNAMWFGEPIPLFY